MFVLSYERSCLESSGPPPILSSSWIPILVAGCSKSGPQASSRAITVGEGCRAPAKPQPALPGDLQGTETP